MLEALLNLNQKFIVKDCVVKGYDEEDDVENTGSSTYWLADVNSTPTVEDHIGAEGVPWQNKYNSKKTQITKRACC